MQICRVCVIGGFGGFAFLLLAVVMEYFGSVEISQRYQDLCQMTCLEEDVNALRADLWDMNFWRYRICKLTYNDACTNPYRLDMQRKSKFTLQRKGVPDVDDFVFSSSEFDRATIYLKEIKKSDFYENNLGIIYEYESEKNFIHFELKRSRFIYNNLLDFPQSDSGLRIFVYVQKANGKLKSEVINGLILIVMQLNNASMKDNVTMSIGTRLFDQTVVVLSQGSKLHSWSSTAVMIWFVAILYYFIFKLLSSFYELARAFYLISPDINKGDEVKFVRPGLICVESKNLNIPVAYFYSRILQQTLPLRSKISFLLLAVSCLISVHILYDIGTRGFWLKIEIPCLLILLVIISVMFVQLSVFFLFSFLLVFLLPALFPVITYWDKISITGYEINYRFFDCVFYLGGACLYSIFMIVDKKRFLSALINREFHCHLLWPTWPVQMIMYLIEKGAKGRYARLIINVLAFCALAYLCFKLPELFKNEVQYIKQRREFTGFWLFGPVYLGLNIIFKHYGKERMLNIAIEAVSVTLFVAYLSNYLLAWLYPTLEMLGDQVLSMVAIISLTLVNYLRVRYKDWCNKYENFLNAVVSYIRKKYRCKLNRGESDQNTAEYIFNVHNHIDINQCQMVDRSRKEDGILFVKGLIIIIIRSKIFIPPDFFFEVIKLPGGPGSIKCVIIKEICSLILIRLFPAVFIYWLCCVMYFADFAKYGLVISFVLGTHFISQYKEFFLQREVSIVNVEKNIRFQGEIDKFMDNFENCLFIV